MSFTNSITNTSAALPQYANIPPSSGLLRRAAEDQQGQRSRIDDALNDAVLDSSFRIARARAIRAEILNRTYETPERIERTVERLLDVIG